MAAQNRSSSDHNPAAHRADPTCAGIRERPSARTVLRREVLQSRMRRSDTLAVHAAITTGTIQGTTFRSRNNPFVCPLVSPIRPQFPKSRRDDGGEEPVGGPCHNLALGQAFRAHSKSTASPRTPATNRSWRVDETYVRVAGQWTYRIELWIPLATRSILCCRRSETLRQPSCSCVCHYRELAGTTGFEPGWRTGIQRQREVTV